MEEAFVKLIEFVEAASPAVWATVLQQVRVEIFASACWAGMWAVLAMLCGIFSYCSYRRILEEPPDEDSWDKRDRKRDNDFWIWACGLSVSAVILASVPMLCNLISAVKMSMNPNYYAIEALLKLFGAS